MDYGKVRRGRFIQRPNRFIAMVDVDGVVERCHVRNTGRCKELLIPGATVVLEDVGGSERSTRYSLIAVYKGDRLVNMDSQIPNRVIEEGISKVLSLSDGYSMRREHPFGDSRIDLFVMDGDRRILVEVKGVTLEMGNVAMFPDAPTVRGVKHTRELMNAVGEGYECYLVLLIQMSNVDLFTPNYDMHMEFGKALEEAERAGVKVVAFDCNVTDSSIGMGNRVRVEFRHHR